MSIIKSFSVGEGDMFYIKHGSDNFTTIDCCYSDIENRNKNYEEICNQATGKGITRFISTHPDEDHIKGLPYFCDVIGITNFYCVKNEAIKPEKSDNFDKYCELRDSDKSYYVYKNCERKWLNMFDSERGSSGINFIWPSLEHKEFINALEAVKNGREYNNVSPIFTYSLENNIVAMWMGDLEHDFLEKVKDAIAWPKVDILFAPHHGRDSGKVPFDVLKKIDPYIIIVGEAPSKYLNYYKGYNTITQNTAGDITFECSNNLVNIYISNNSYSYDISFLKNIFKYNKELGNYLGSFIPNNAE